ncbi:MAG TPA: SusD/RagB family nutrient-binding outer membrane lipoprotein [Chitinophagaceae bacterium]
MNKQTYYLAFLLFLIVGISSCKKTLDINEDPNNSTRASVDLVLPTAQVYTAYNMASPFGVLGGIWGQYWTQGPTANQYNTYEQYVLTSSTFNRQWESMYSGPLADFRYLHDEGLRVGQENYAAIGKIMQAYVFQYLTDLHGDIPFSEALDPAIASPKFDSQEEVYNGLITLVDEGLALIDEHSASRPGSDDLVYGGDMEQWRRFANTLKLRIYLRQAYVRPAVAEAGIKAMYAAGAQFLETGGDADIGFASETFNQHPLYRTNEALTSDNILASNTALNFMESTNDPRIEVFYQEATKAPNAGQFAGIDQGDGKNLTGTLDAGMWSKPGPAVGGPNGGEDAPVVLMSAAESYFLQAEAAARSWGSGDPKDLYENGISASFLYWGLSMAEAVGYYSQAAVNFPAGASTEQKIEAIITQKWVSMNGTQNVEAWTEWRRTGYPDFFVVSTTSNIGNVFPVRLLYAESEIARNPNTPAQKAVTDKVWWDVNTTGQN